MPSLEVLRIEIEGVATSFRYPYFSQGTQPTYEVPPLATLYGHICSAIGDYVDPSTFKIGYHFTYETRYIDYEHTHFFGRTPKLSPTNRELLFQPRLTLYIDRPDWFDYFRWPRYVTTLGRSQDLMQYRNVQVMQLHLREDAYLEHTIVPMELSSELKHWTMVILPRYITPDREVQWGKYAHVKKAQALTQPMYCDLTMPKWRDMQRAVYLHTLVGHD